MKLHDWHIPSDQLSAYRRGALQGAAADSTEAHLLACPECRQALAAAARPADQARQDRVWAAVADEIDRPTTAERLGAGWLRLSLGSPTLRWVTAALVLLVLAPPLAAAAVSGRAGWVVLFVVAPLAPVAAVVAAYRPETDPAGAITAATPLATFQLVLLRALVVLAAAAPIGLLASALLPARLSLLVGWLLPGLALSSIVLLVGTRTDPTRLAIGLAAGWAVAVLGAAADLRRLPAAEALDAVFVTHPATQQASALVLVVATAVLVSRRSTLTPWSTS